LRGGLGQWRIGIHVTLELGGGRGRRGVGGGDPLSDISDDRQRAVDHVDGEPLRRVAALHLPVVFGEHGERLRSVGLTDLGGDARDVFGFPDDHDLLLLRGDGFELELADIGLRRGNGGPGALDLGGAVLGDDGQRSDGDVVVDGHGRDGDLQLAVV
jgi:hypothetical protein